MKVLLATGAQDIDKFIREQAINYEVSGDVPYRKPIIEKVSDVIPDVLVLSSLLPGDEDLREIVFEVQRITNCRIVFLAGDIDCREELILDMFFLGIRDFVYDPIDPKVLLDCIIRPATYTKAVSHLKKTPKVSRKLMDRIGTLAQKNAAPPQAEISDTANELIAGMLAVLKKKPGKTLEDNLLSIEEGIGELLTGGD